MPAATIGINEFLDSTLHGSSQNATWYVGLISNSGFTGLAAADTMSSHAGWTEATGYSESTRPEWTEGAAANGAITATAPAVFSFTSTQVIIGAFLVSNSTKGGTTGNLKTSTRWLFSSARTLNSGQKLALTLSIQGAM